MGKKIPRVMVRTGVKTGEKEGVRAIGEFCAVVKAHKVASMIVWQYTFSNFLSCLAVDREHGQSASLDIRNEMKSAPT